MIRNKAGKAFNGSKVELCPVCDEAFTGTRAGDMHRVIDHKYTLARRGRDVVHVMHGHVVPDGYKAIPGINERRRCLSRDEMVARGMRLTDAGTWSSGGAYWGIDTD